MLAGKLFHRVAAALANVRSPYVAVLDLGTVNEMVDHDTQFQEHCDCDYYTAMNYAIFKFFQGTSDTPKTPKYFKCDIWSKYNTYKINFVNFY